MDKVIVLTGPTAVGKSKIGLKIAQKFNFEIINGDAYQIYKKMDIGTAKPTNAERLIVPHHLFDFLEPNESFSICDYQKLVRQEITKQKNNNKTPFIVGGSGLYINSVIYDYQFTSQKRTNIYKNISSEELYNKLKKINPNINIDINNRKRLERALENASNMEKLNQKNKDIPVYDNLVFFLYDNRDELYKRINERVDQMIKLGLVEEVKSLYPDNIASQAQAAIGYKEIISYLNNEISLDTAISLIKQHTRNYAKRQFTWFKHQTNAIWINVENKDTSTIVKEIESIITEFLNK